MKLPAALYFGVLFAALAAASATAGEAEEADVAAAPLEPLFPDSEDEERVLGREMRQDMRLDMRLDMRMRHDNVFARQEKRDRDLETNGLRRRDGRRHGAAVPSDGEDRDLESEAELDSEDFNYFGVPMP